MGLLYLAYDTRIERFRLRAGRFGKPQAAKDILETDSRVTWVASTQTPGTSYLFYVRGGSLLVQPFDGERLHVTGDAVPLADSLHVFQPTAAADFSVSTNGVLVYQPLRKNARVAWVDRAGRELERVGPDGQSVVYVRASPDGRKVAASVHNPEKGAAEIWVYDTRSKVNRVVAPGPGITDKPVWSPDGTRLLYSRALGAGPRLYVRGLGEQDREEELPAAADLQLPSDWSRDGRFALFHSENVTDGDVGVLDSQTRKMTWILQSPANETGAVFSPEGDRIAFISNESGRPEVYVQAFDKRERPHLTGDRVRISTDGAVLVRWRGDGRSGAGNGAPCCDAGVGVVPEAQATGRCTALRPTGVSLALANRSHMGATTAIHMNG
jgi:Tol biopolymer transport system component